MVFVGHGAYFRDLSAWLDLNSGGWPIKQQNQAMIAAADRLTNIVAALGGLTSNWRLEGVRTVADAPVATALAVAVLVTLTLVGVFTLRTIDRSLARAPIEIASVVILGVLSSPIAWDHNWVLLFPAFYLARRAAHPALLGPDGDRFVLGGGGIGDRDRRREY
jgi:hypothetical protein